MAPIPLKVPTGPDFTYEEEDFSGDEDMPDIEPEDSLMHRGPHGLHHLIRSINLTVDTASRARTSRA